MTKLQIKVICLVNLLALRNTQTKGFQWIFFSSIFNGDVDKIFMSCLKGYSVTRSSLAQLVVFVTVTLATFISVCHACRLTKRLSTRVLSGRRQTAAFKQLREEIHREIKKIILWKFKHSDSCQRKFSLKKIHQSFFTKAKEQTECFPHVCIQWETQAGLHEVGRSPLDISHSLFQQCCAKEQKTLCLTHNWTKKQKHHFILLIEL